MNRKLSIRLPGYKIVALISAVCFLWGHHSWAQPKNRWCQKLLERARADAKARFEALSPSYSLEAIEGPISNETLANLIQTKQPRTQNYIKDQPGIGYRITGSVKDIPQAIRDHLGEVDATKYSDEYFQINAGSIINLQVNGDKPDFYIIGIEVYQQKYRPVALEEAGLKNPKLVQKLEAIPGLQDLLHSGDPHLVGALKTAPIAMVRMSDIGLPVGEAVRIESPWGEQTKPAGQDAWLVWDESQNMYYMVNSSDSGLPISYIEAE